MPGVIVFRRRWSVGSDDLIVPALLLCIFHAIWLTVLIITAVDQIPLLDTTETCQYEFLQLIIGFLVVWSLSILVQSALIIVSLRGTILEDELRWHSEYLLYIKLVLWLAEIGFTIFCVIWMKNHYAVCAISTGNKNMILGLVVCNSILFLTALLTIWCSFDVAGRSWVKLKKYQQSLRDQNTKKFQYKRSGGNSSRSWRHRKVRRAYQNRWDSRCQLLLCCVNPGNRKGRNSFSDIAKMLSEFFRDLDVVPSDIAVGLVLLSKRQRLLRLRTIHQTSNPVYQFLSGVRVTPKTQFLDPTNETEAKLLHQIYHYMHFAYGVYGWPMYLRNNCTCCNTAICKLCASLKCLCLPSCHQKPLESLVLEDNCCGCNYAAYNKMCDLPDTHLVYITYHVDVGEIPFLVAVDFSERSIVVSIRGTLSLEDIITDLNAEGEPLPIRPINEDWIGHKGMAGTAAYIYKKLKEDHLLTKAFNYDQARGTQDFDIICVGHSLGAGTATILAIMLKQEFPNTKCFAYSPPGGLLSQEAVEYSKSFVTSVIIGKDVVPRIGLHQLEALRHDLVYAIHKSSDPKWKTLASSLICCLGSKRMEEWTEAEVEAQLSPKKQKPAKIQKKENSGEDKGEEENQSLNINIHPWDSTVNLSVHQPLYPPGRILHVVRYYPRTFDEKGASDPIYKAIWADNKSFDEVLISKRMVQDHMPDNVLGALEKLVNQNPQKTCHFGEIVPRIVVQEPTSITNECCLEKWPTNQVEVEVSDSIFETEAQPDIEIEAVEATEATEAVEAIEAANHQNPVEAVEEKETSSNTPEVASSHLEERHVIKNGIEESLPLFDEGVEAVKDVAPIASPDYSIAEDISVSGACISASGACAISMATSSTHPTASAVQTTLAVTASQTAQKALAAQTALTTQTALTAQTALAGQKAMTAPKALAAQTALASQKAMTDQTAPAAQTTPADQTALADQTASASQTVQTASAAQTDSADQTALLAQKASSAQTTLAASGEPASADLTASAAQTASADQTVSATQTAQTASAASGLPQLHQNAQIDSTSYPAFHSTQTEYHSQSNVQHIEPFYRYRVYSDAS